MNVFSFQCKVKKGIAFTYYKMEQYHLQENAAQLAKMWNTGKTFAKGDCINSYKQLVTIKITVTNKY